MFFHKPYILPEKYHITFSGNLFRVTHFISYFDPIVMGLDTFVCMSGCLNLIQNYCGKFIFIVMAAANLHI